MARKINSRLKIYGTLQAETPLHVGGYGVDVDTDLPLARNGKNELYVPGTSITGVLRAWCEMNFGAKEIGEIFGPKREKGIDEGHASFVLIEDAQIIKPKVNVDGKDAEQEILTEIRDGVGINRFYGTAADGAKYDRAILPKGSKLKFEMTVEIEDRKLKPKDKRKNNQDFDETEEQFQNRVNATKAIIGNLLDALENEKIRFGASKTRGLGRVKFQLKEILDENFQGFDNILDLFDTSNKSTVSIQKLIDSDEAKTPNPSKPKLEITIEWKPRLPLMVKAGYEGIGVDMLPVTSGVANDKLALVLAGSSIKGAFRSHAERIMRTLLDRKPLIKEELIPQFNDQIKKIPIVEELFGAKKEKSELNPKLGLGALSIDDCYSVESFDQDAWRKVETGKVTKTNENGKETEVSYYEQELWQATEKIGAGMTNQTKIADPHFHITHHTAIDRFTGGVADGALYSVLAPHNIQWQKIKLSLDFGRTENDKCCLMLLLLVLRDLAENRLPLGFATNCGMGEVEIQKIEIKGKYQIVWDDGEFKFAEDNLKNNLTRAWSQQIGSLKKPALSNNEESGMPENQADQKTLPLELERNVNEVLENSFLEQESLKIDQESKYFLTKRDAYRLSGDIYNKKYELEEYAGCGGMGAVYRAKDLVNKKQVAIKIIKPDIVFEEPFLLKKFLEEVNNTMKLSHPNIIQAIDSGEAEDGTTYMILEWLDGATLQDVLNVDKLSIIRLSKIFTQICLGIAEAHRNGIIHLDIKPKNIYWFNDDVIKVIDFGLSKAIDESRSGVLLTTIRGTKEYCAPERLHQNVKCTKQSDIYSLGVVLYQLCSGNLDPFNDNYDELKRNHENLLPPLPSLSDVDSELSVFDSIIEKAIKTNPIERYDSVEELLKDFENALSEKAIDEGEEHNEQN